MKNTPIKEGQIAPEFCLLLPCRPITLLSDEDVTVHKKYGVWRMKKFIGREFLGTIRTTFLIDPQGKVAKIWDGVKVTAHAEEVLETLKNEEKSFIRKDKHFKRGDLEK